jgi:hypothetical protein
MKNILHPTGTLVIVPNGSPMAYRGHHAHDAKVIPMNRFVCETADGELIALVGSLGEYVRRFDTAWIYDGDKIGIGRNTEVLPLLLRAAIAVCRARGAEIMAFDDEDITFARTRLGVEYPKEGCTAVRVANLCKACKIKGISFGSQVCPPDGRAASSLNGLERLMAESLRRQEFWNVPERGHKSVEDLVSAFR